MKKYLSSILAVVIVLFCSSSCMQNAGGPRYMSGDRGLTTGIHVDSVNVRTVTTRVTGRSTGFKLLGFIPIQLASETEAVVNMYENARQRGCAPEGYARQFVNNSVEHSSNYFILFSMPKVRATGDLVEILPPAPAPVAAPASSSKKR